MMLKSKRFLSTDPSLEKDYILLILSIDFRYFSTDRNVKILMAVFILTLFIKRIGNIRRDIKGKNQEYNGLSKEKYKGEELSKTEEQLKTA